MIVRDHLYNERSFPVQKYAHDRLPTDKRPYHKQPRTRSLRFLLPRFVLVLLVAVVTVTMAVQSAYGCPGGNNGGGDNGGGNNGGGDNGGGDNGGGISASTKKASGKASITLQDGQATLNTFSLSGAPKDTPLIIHIHAQNKKSALPADICKGPVLFVIKDPTGGDPVIKTDADGKFSLKKQAFELAPPAPGAAPAPSPDLSKIGTWYVNVHDATKPLPPDPQNPNGPTKFVSIACGLIKVGANATKGSAKLKAEVAKPVSEAPAPPVPVTNLTKR